jgi:hypothetical protein
MLQDWTWIKMKDMESLQQAESSNQEDDVLDVIERAEEDAMLRRK